MKIETNIVGVADGYWDEDIHEYIEAPALLYRAYDDTEAGDFTRETLIEAIAKYRQILSVMERYLEECEPIPNHNIL